jgi:hypothetical protein
MKTQKINSLNLDFPGFSTTDANRSVARIGHVNYALSQVDIASGIDTLYTARGRVSFNSLAETSPQVLKAGNVLIIGEKYIIDNFVDGDDFTNVGAAENVAGVVFVATGENPATWIGSALIQNAANYISEIMDKTGEQKNLKWSMVDKSYGQVTATYSDRLAYNKGFEYIGGPSTFTESITVFDYAFVDPEVVLQNVEYFYGVLSLVNFDCKVYDSLFPNLEFEIVAQSDAGAFLVIKDNAVDFRNYTVWSSPIAASVYRSLNTGDIKYPIGSTGRATAVSDAAYLSEFVDSEDGKIYIPVFEPKLGLRFDFEIRLYDYVAPIPETEASSEEAIPV